MEKEDTQMYFTFSRVGDDRIVDFQFNLDRDVSWMQIMPFFLDFLKANGYIFDNNHELYRMCDYERN